MSSSSFRGMMELYSNHKLCMFCLEPTDTKNEAKRYLHHCLNCDTVSHDYCLEFASGTLDARCCDLSQAGRKRVCDFCGKVNALQRIPGERALHAVCKFNLEYCKNQLEDDNEACCIFCKSSKGVILRCSSEQNLHCRFVFHQKCHEDAMHSLPCSLERFFSGSINLKCYLHSEDNKKIQLKSYLKLKYCQLSQGEDASMQNAPVNMSFLGVNTREKWNNFGEASLQLNFEDEKKTQDHAKLHSATFIASRAKPEQGLDETAKALLNDMGSSKKSLKVNIPLIPEEDRPTPNRRSNSRKTVCSRKSSSRTSKRQSEIRSTSKALNDSQGKLDEFEFGPVDIVGSPESHKPTQFINKQRKTDIERLEQLAINIEAMIGQQEIDRVKLIIAHNFDQYKTYVDSDANQLLFEPIKIESLDLNLAKLLSEGHQKAWDLINLRIGRVPKPSKSPHFN